MADSNTQGSLWGSEVYDRQTAGAWPTSWYAVPPRKLWAWGKMVLVS